MGKKTAKKKAMRKAKLRRGRQEQRQVPAISRRRRLRRLMRHSKLANR